MCAVSTGHIKMAFTAGIPGSTRLMSEVNSADSQKGREDPLLGLTLSGPNSHAIHLVVGGIASM